MRIGSLKEEGWINCESNCCPFRQECANHTTAGDFRSEGGFTPKVRIDEEETIHCLSINSEVQEGGHGDWPVQDAGNGGLTVKQGELYVYHDPYPNGTTPYPVQTPEERVKELEAEREKLLEYAQHKELCPTYKYGTACTCGFDALIQEIEGIN